jgi:hypothetical protein
MENSVQKEQELQILYMHTINSSTDSLYAARENRENSPARRNPLRSRVWFPRFSRLGAAA